VVQQQQRQRQWVRGQVQQQVQEQVRGQEVKESADESEAARVRGMRRFGMARSTRSTAAGCCCCAVRRCRSLLAQRPLTINLFCIAGLVLAVSERKEEGCVSLQLPTTACLLHWISSVHVCRLSGIQTQTDGGCGCILGTAVPCASVRESLSHLHWGPLYHTAVQREVSDLAHCLCCTRGICLPAG
jgi:hypothetical protein